MVISMGMAIASIGFQVFLGATKNFCPVSANIGFKRFFLGFLYTNWLYLTKQLQCYGYRNCNCVTGMKNIYKDFIMGFNNNNFDNNNFIGGLICS